MIKICTDRYLPTRQSRISAAKFAIQENKDNRPSGNFTHPLSLALETGQKWANGRVINCCFIEGTKTQKIKVEREAHKWEEFANIQFKFVNDPKADVRIAFQQNAGSWSTIGTDCTQVPFDEQTMNYGWLLDDTSDDEYQRVVVHEFGHLLGCIHEHQSPAANIPWNKDVVYKYYMGPPNSWSREDVDVNLFAKYSTTLTQFSIFDIKSIMLYAIPKELTIGGYEIGWNTQLSDTDKIYIATSYPKYNVVVPSQIIPGAAPLVGSLNKNEVKELELKVDFSQGGNYLFTTYPKTMWISIWSGNIPVKSGKGNISAKLGPGKYKVRTRQSTGTGVYNISCRKV